MRLCNRPLYLRKIRHLNQRSNRGNPRPHNQIPTRNNLLPLSQPTNQSKPRPINRLSSQSKPRLLEYLPGRNQPRSLIQLLNQNQSKPRPQERHNPNIVVRLNRNMLLPLERSAIHDPILLLIRLSWLSLHDEYPDRFLKFPRSNCRHLMNRIMTCRPRFTHPTTHWTTTLRGITDHLQESHLTISDIQNIL